MNTTAARISALVLVSLMLAGCSVGRESMVFATKSNIGIDIDTKPPTAEISISRKEGVIAPAFEGGQTPTVLASFRSEYKGLVGLFFNVASTFAGGDSAATMSKLFGNPEPEQKIEESFLCLTQIPQWPDGEAKTKLPVPGEVRPFVFSTDTVFGLKAAWSGTAAQWPDSVKLGYNRKEMAWAPVFSSNEDCPAGKPLGKKVNVPSFLATIDVVSDISSQTGSTGEHIQYFATGAAATNLALQPEIRKAMLRRIDPEAAKQLEKFKDYTQNQNAQSTSIKNIRTTYDKATPTEQAKIRENAVNLELVPSGTTDAEFKAKLFSNFKPQDSEITKKLKMLEELAK